MTLDYDDEPLARQCEEELWLQEQKISLEVNINWKQLLKQAKDQNDSQCNSVS
jgi:hypothetical protein